MADSQHDVRNPLLNGEDGGGAEGRRTAEGEEEEELDLERSNDIHNAATQLECNPLFEISFVIQLSNTRLYPCTHVPFVSFITNTNEF